MDHLPPPRRTSEPDAARRALPRVLGALLLGVLAPACGSGDERPTWIRLAHGFEPASEFEDATWLPDPEDARTRPAGDRGYWVEVAIRRRAWSRGWLGTDVEGVWVTTVPVPEVASPPDGSLPQRLEADGRDFAMATLDGSRGDAREISPGSFLALRGVLYLLLDADQEPPSRSTFHAYVDPGIAKAGSWRVRMERFAGAGLPVWPGLCETVVVDVPPRSVLRVSTAAVGREPASGPDPDTIRFRVRLNGETVLDHVQPALATGTRENHAIPLPPAGLGGARLTFEVEGDRALSAFLAPVVGPAEIGRYGDRPWRPAGPDVVVLVMDTFRADNMELYGGEPGITPNLDAFARTSLRFLNAWSPASWTLPAHVSLFSGLDPPEHAVTKSDSAVPDEIAMLAERFRSAGWRTGAVTDGSYVSADFGLDHGFESWDEMYATFDSTLERVESFLRADDGRPILLFVQTYRAHAPYEASDEVRAALGDRLAMATDIADVAAVHRDAPMGWRLGNADAEAVRAAFRPVHHLYLGGVADLDRRFEELLALLDHVGPGREGFLLVTSDHGESFGEHGFVYHGLGVWQEVLRVPLLLRGPGFEPRDVELGASLVDVPRTLAGLAGIEPHPSWGGKSLVSLEEERVLLGFECREAGDRYIGATLGPRRIVAREPDGFAVEAELHGAFDLSRDPRELENLSAEPPGWSDELRDAAAARRARLAEPVAPPGKAVLTAEDRQRLRELGYVDE